MKEKEIYKYLKDFNLSDEEKESLSEYVDIIVSESKDIQKKININNFVNLIKNIELLKGNQNDNKKDT